MTVNFEKRILLDDINVLHKLFGNMDENIKNISREFDVEIASRGGEIIIVGKDNDELKLVETLLVSLIETINSGNEIDSQKIDYYISSVREGDISRVADLNDEIIIVTARGKFIKPKTFGQKKYYKAIMENDVTFGVGPAGTGKTYLAVAMAVKAFKNNDVSRIIITRPAVEAGESLGFLPGDLQTKVDPYLRPLYDALYDILGAETYLKFKERGLIEVAPLAYMRGRTLDNSFIILDEAQNTTKEQMKMFLTRFGFGSKVVVNGDTTQIDLPGGKKSGLIDAVEILRNVEGISVVELTKRDVVRHKLVKKIIEQYEKQAERENRRNDRNDRNTKNVKKQERK